MRLGTEDRDDHAGIQLQPWTRRPRGTEERGEQWCRATRTGGARKAIRLGGPAEPPRHRQTERGSPERRPFRRRCAIPAPHRPADVHVQRQRPEGVAGDQDQGRVGRAGPGSAGPRPGGQLEAGKEGEVADQRPMVEQPPLECQSEVTDARGARVARQFAQRAGREAELSVRREPELGGRDRALDPPAVRQAVALDPGFDLDPAGSDRVCMDAPAEPRAGRTPAPPALSSPA
jgi:hypothetical protein